jgi:hypothetical protein
MRKKKFLLIALLVSVCPRYSSGANLTFEQLESGKHMMRNPFQSQLPEKRKPPEAPNPKVKIEDPKGAIEKPKVSQPNIESVAPKVIETPMPQLTIKGVIWNSDRPQAIINDQIIDIGDKISEVTVTGIRKGGIDVMFHGKKSTLTP